MTTTTTDHVITDILIAIDDDTAINAESDAFWTYLEQHIAPAHLQEALDLFSKYEGRVEEHAVKVTLQWIAENGDELAD